MSRTLLLWLVPLLLSLVSHQALAQRQGWVVTRSKSVTGNDINCRKLGSEGKAATACQEVGPCQQLQPSPKNFRARHVSRCQQTFDILCTNFIVSCMQCGGVAAVAFKCQQDPKCNGFDM
jgi:hypothetical protein